MLEDIKKEVELLLDDDCDYVYRKEVLEILDKYKFKNDSLNKVDNIESYINELEKRNKEYLEELLKYKNAWEELKKEVLGEDENGENVCFETDGTMQKLEQKYNIRKEDLDE